MALVLSIIGIAFAAFCVWVLIRVINRRDNSDNEFLAIICIAVLLLLMVIAPSIGLYWAFSRATRPKSGVAKKMAVPPPVPPPGR
jgi:Kef-type K+ transport system membrane component KefB